LISVFHNMIQFSSLAYLCHRDGWDSQYQIISST